MWEGKLLVLLIT